MTSDDQKVLILEDNPGDFFLIKEFLKRTSFSQCHIYHAESVSTAIALLQEHAFKFILMDLFLPDSEGIQTFERIFPLSQQAPVIALTGLVNEEVTLGTLQRGAQDYLVKGEYDEKLLEKTIRYAIERKHNQELLKRSEEEYKLLFESNPIPMFAYDVGTLCIHRVNEASIAFYGYTREEFCTLTIKDIRPKEDLPRLEEHLTQQLNTDGMYKAGEWRHCKKDGTVVDVEIVNHSIVIGGVKSKLAAIYDLTERNKAQDHLHLLESVITNTNDAILISEAEPIDAPGPKIVYVNDAFTRMTGYTLAEVVGKTPRILQSEKTDRVQLDNIREAMSQWKSSEAELINIRKNGEEFWNSFSLVPVANNAGWFTHWVSIQRDVTVRRESEKISRQRLEALVRERTKELQESVKKEKQLVELKNQFVAIASHEFRTPLSTIRFAADYLHDYLERLEAVEIKSKLKKIEKQVLHMTALLEDVIMAGRSELSKIPVIKSHIDLQNFITKIIEEVQNSTKNSHCIELHYSAKIESIETDEKLLRNIFINILSNAIKFSPEKKQVIFKIDEENTDLCFEVIDTGIGISEDDQAKLFEAFHRGSNASTIAGTGLGLSIVKKAVELLGGSIVVNSTINQGTSIKILLPILS